MVVNVSHNGKKTIFWMGCACVSAYVAYRFWRKREFKAIDEGFEEVSKVCCVNHCYWYNHDNLLWIYTINWCFQSKFRIIYDPSPSFFLCPDSPKIYSTDSAAQLITPFTISTAFCSSFNQFIAKHFSLLTFWVIPKYCRAFREQNPVFNETTNITLKPAFWHLFLTYYSFESQSSWKRNYFLLHFSYEPIIFFTFIASY